MPGQDDHWPQEWMRGVLELCVLGVLGDGPAHGYVVAQRLNAAGLGSVKGGTLYPLLGRLETGGLLEASWEVGTGGPGRKVFRLTAAGRAESLRRSQRWAEFVRRTHTLLPAVQEAP